MSTEAARNEMRFAHQYIEAFYKTKDVPRRPAELYDFLCEYACP